MEFVPFIILAAMVKKLIDWLRTLIPDHIEAKVLIPVSWAVGAAVAFLFSTSPALAGDIVIWGEHTLANADAALVAVYGIAVASAGGIIHDLVKPSTPPHDGR
jgi:hypothetical protein